MAGKALRRLSTVFKDTDRKRKSFVELKGAAIPYPEPELSTQDSDLWDPPYIGTNGDPVICKRSLSTASGVSSNSSLCRLNSTDLAEVEAWKEGLKMAVAERDLVKMRTLLVEVDPALTESVDEICTSSLLVAMENNDVEMTDVILDYMTSSQDKKPRSPFVLIRLSAEGGQRSVVERYPVCCQFKSFSKRGVSSVQLLVLHGQRSDDLAIFLYSVLDVPVANTFIIKSSGDVNMKNFQRYERKNFPEVLSVWRTRIRSMELLEYQNLRILSLVSCGLTKVSLEGLQSLTHLDLRNNQLTVIPEGVRECRRLKVIRVAGNGIMKLPDGIRDLEHLEELDCSGNHLKRMTPFIVNCSRLSILRCSDNDLYELPLDLGLLTGLEELIVHNNKLDRLPLSIASLPRLQRLRFYNNPLQNIPSDFPERPADVRKYLSSLQDHPIRNALVKLVVVGQEGVGKTTLVRALRKTLWTKLPRNSSRCAKRNSGIVFKDIRLDDFTLRCFDCSGDVAFNETHNFFISPGAIYLACFNISDFCLSTIETNSFLLGRLQLWLQHICSRVPNAQVLIVGTHADHPSVNRSVLEEIWNQIRKLLAEERPRHQSYFRDAERLNDCLLCQSDCRIQSHSTGTGGESNGFINPAYEAPNETDWNGDKQTERTPIAFPHIVGYYKVCSVKNSKGSGQTSPPSVSPDVEGLKEAIRELALRVIRTSLEIPRRWADVRESLQSHVTRNPENCLMTVEGVARFAEAHGVSERLELTNMLHFFRAQGSLLYFPQLSDLEEIVVLDQEWLARIFASVVSSRTSEVDEFGMVDRDRMKNSWTEIEPTTREKVLILLRYFGLCFPIEDSRLELFPSKLPLGDPDLVSWPSRPERGQREVTYSVTFISSIPPPFFNTLMSTVYSYRASSDATKSQGVIDGASVPRPLYFSNLFVETLRPDVVGCRNCGYRRTGSADGVVEDLDLIHQVLFEQIPHRRSIQVTARGAVPCCLIRKVSRIVTKVVHSYEGLQNLTLDSVVCPACLLEKHPRPHRFLLSSLEAQVSDSAPLSCDQGHSLSDARGLLSGITHLPETSSSPRPDRNQIDYSGCPRLFVVLPVSRDGTRISRDLTMFASSLVFDGYAVHFLCEFPDDYHLTSSLGYRLSNPKEFMRVYGARVLAILHLLDRMSDAGSSSMPAGTTAENVIRDLTTKFPVVKDTFVAMATDGLRQFVDEDDGKIRRQDLRRMLRLVDQADCFGPLIRSIYHGRFIWLCHDHYRQLEQLTSGSKPDVRVNGYS